MAKGDMYLKLKTSKAGELKGESSSPGHVDEIDIEEWSWGMQSPRDLSGTGARARTALSELRVTKRVDRASTALMQVMRNNEAITEATLAARKVTGAAQGIDYFTIKIKGGRITEISVGTEERGTPGLIERLAIAFEEIEVTYKSQSGGGGMMGASMFNASVERG